MKSSTEVQCNSLMIIHTFNSRSIRGNVIFIVPLNIRGYQTFTDVIVSSVFSHVQFIYSGGDETRLEKSEEVSAVSGKCTFNDWWLHLDEYKKWLEKVQDPELPNTGVLSLDLY